jgi:hypothetical protein
VLFLFFPGPVPLKSSSWSGKSKPKVVLEKFLVLSIDEVVKSLRQCLCVIPANAGIQYYQSVLAPRVRGRDNLSTFTRSSSFKAVDWI